MRSLQDVHTGVISSHETTRKHRLRVCLKCLWYFGRAYNQPGVFQPLPSYFSKSLIPEIVRLVQAEKDTIVRVMRRCVIAVVVNKVVEDHKSGSIPLDDGVCHAHRLFLIPGITT